MISPACFSGGGLIAEDSGLGAGLADLAGLDADVAGGLGVERLLLRAHDRLQRRVAGLVDRVTDGDHGGQLDLDGVVAVLGLTLAAELALGDVDLDDLRQRRHLQVVGHDRADRVALAVVRLLAEQDQVGRLGLEHLREGVARRADVGAGESVVGEVHRAVGAERDGLVQGANRGSGPMVTATISSTSASPPSRICMAASMPWVSNGFRFFSPERSSRLVPDRSASEQRRPGPP